MKDTKTENGTNSCDILATESLALFIDSGFIMEPLPGNAAVIFPQGPSKHICGVHTVTGPEPGSCQKILHGK